MDERIIKYCQGKLNKDEEAELLKEAYSDSSLKSRIIEYQHLHSLIGLQNAAANRRAGEDKYMEFRQRMDRWKIRRLALKWGRYAAVLVLAVLSSWFLSYNFYQSKSPEFVAAQQELNVPAGQRAELTLPDGTKVWLNARSRLTYPSVFTGERKVFLSGEGFFSVTKNAKMPFIVSTQTIDVKALGTEFNVCSYPEMERTEVYLQEGSVKTYFPEFESKGLVLSPGQFLVQAGNTFNLRKMDVETLLWKDGIYVFKKQKLANIIEKLELYFDVDIVVKDPEILDYEYVGKFRQRDGILTILQVIQKIHKFKIEKNDELNRIVLSK
ncbi:FecR domain-containing protein [Massilibacteroides sp.]|uniref:FecR family protein n=1 Tax=Massilibacteroides sp. TaxID=2034766 RepID=UPI00263517AD|nr:FecR domain-containing protein [Massilibacteroides sp.]MDD4513979.1 FecR domain-containing protein [Massilibacteroides sp.]